MLGDRKAGRRLGGWRSRAGWLAAAGLALSACATGRATPVLGQADTFQGGSSDNWSNGHGLPPVSSTGGPPPGNGPYMVVSANGIGGAGSKLVVFNQSQWAGDYTAQNAADNVTAIGMDLEEISGPANTPLTMRIALQTGSASSPGWVSLTGYTIPNDGQWHHAIFPIDTTNLTPVGGPPPLDSLLTDVGELRLLESASPAVEGDVIAATVGATNITPLPEPAGGALAAVASALLVRRRRRRGDTAGS